VYDFFPSEKQITNELWRNLLFFNIIGSHRDILNIEYN